MAQYFLDAESRRQISMALSVREQSAVAFSKARREIWALLLASLHISTTSDEHAGSKDKSRTISLSIRPQ